jgi:glycerol-3-phosphate dehydrogenase
VAGIVVRDVLDGRAAELRAPIVVSATGAWADGLRGDVGAPPRIRPLRGSHLIFPHERVPVTQAISFAHPADGRPLFLFPWEGRTIFGTTDVDHPDPLAEEPRMSADEAGYLMEALAARVPSLELRLEDAISSFAGVRPVVGSGKRDPSQESRDHVV